jgi:hypothetical protein
MLLTNTKIHLLGKCSFNRVFVPDRRHVSSEQMRITKLIFGGSKTHRKCILGRFCSSDSEGPPRTLASPSSIMIPLAGAAACANIGGGARPAEGGEQGKCTPTWSRSGEVWHLACVRQDVEEKRWWKVRQQHWALAEQMKRRPLAAPRRPFLRRASDDIAALSARSCLAGWGWCVGHSDAADRVATHALVDRFREAMLERRCSAGGSVDLIWAHRVVCHAVLPRVPLGDDSGQDHVCGFIWVCTVCSTSKGTSGGLGRLLLCSRLAAWGWLCLNNGGGPRIFFARRWRSAWFLLSLIWLKSQVPKGSTGVLWKAPPAYSIGRSVNHLMHGDCWIGCDSIKHIHVFWPFGFRGSVANLCCLLPPWDTSYSPWWSQR